MTEILSTSRAQGNTEKITRQLRGLLRPEIDQERKITLLQDAEQAADLFHQTLATRINSEYARFHQAALLDPDLADHSLAHFTRQKALANYVLLKSPELSITDWRMMHGHALFANGHDADQLNVIKRNQQRDAANKLNPRNSYHHEIAGALQVLAQADQYAEATGISREDAKAIAAFAAVQIIFHDSHQVLRPSLIHMRKQHGRKAYRYAFARNNETGRWAMQKQMLHGNDLIALFVPHSRGSKKGQIEGCDLTSLSPAQIRELSIYFKGQEDANALKNASSNAQAPKTLFVDREVTPNGLDADFEKEYKNELDTIGTDDQPLFDHLSHRQRQELISIIEVDVLGDQLDAILPTRLGLLRTLSNDHARRRPIANDHTATYLPYTINPSLDGIDTDLSRKLREVLLIADIVEGTELAKTTFVREILPAMQINYIQQLKRDGEVLIWGESAEVQKMVEEILTDELLHTAQSFARRVGMEISLDPHDEITNETRVHQLLTQLFLAGHIESHDALQRLLNDLPNRITHTTEAIFDPRKNRDGDNDYFTKNQRVERFKQACDEVLYGPADPQRYQEFSGYISHEVTDAKGAVIQFKPRYLAQYTYAHNYMSSGNLYPEETTYPYDSYLHPQQVTRTN